MLSRIIELYGEIPPRMEKLLSEKEACAWQRWQVAERTSHVLHGFFGNTCFWDTHEASNQAGEHYKGTTEMLIYKYFARSNIQDILFVDQKRSPYWMLHPLLSIKHFKEQLSSTIPISMCTVSNMCLM